MFRVYLDNCVFNRPFDDQSNERVRIESAAIVQILEHIKNHSIEVVWSSAIDYENERSPISERRESVAQWRAYAVAEVLATEKVEELSRELLELGVGDVDSIHIASAMICLADYFVTTDDGIIKRKDKIQGIKIISPTELLEIIEK